MRLDPPVGEALRAALGAPAVVRRLSSSPRSRVWLAEVVATLGADHPGLAGLASVSSAIRDRIMVSWPGVRGLPVADGDPVDVYQRSDGGPLA